VAKTIATQLQSRLAEALREFRRDKLGRQQARLSLANAVYAQPSLPKRRIMLSTGASNYRPPLERCKSAPKLGPIDEICEEVGIIIVLIKVTDKSSNFIAYMTRYYIHIFPPTATRSFAKVLNKRT